MTPKEYLQQIRLLDIRIKSIETEIEQLRSEQITLTGIRLDGMPHERNPGDPVGNAAAKLADELTNLEGNLIRTKSELWRKRAEVVALLGKVTEPDYNQILYLRYVKLERWETIACDMGYSFRHTTRLHGEALKEFEKVMGVYHVG